MTATFMQDGGSHVSFEDKLTTKVIPLMLITFTLAAAVIGRLVMKRRGEGGRVHPTLQIMMAALGMHWVFLAVHTMHLRAFAGTDKMWRMAVFRARTRIRSALNGDCKRLQSCVPCVFVDIACSHVLPRLFQYVAAVLDLGSQA